MKRLTTNLSMLLLIAAILFAPPVTGAQAVTDTGTFTFPVERRLFVSCANGGAGEFVVLIGETRVLLHSTGTPRHNLTLRHGQTHLTGVGEITGDVYHATGTRTDTVNDGAVDMEIQMNIFRIVGQGPDNNFTIHQTLHIIFTPTEKTITNAHLTIECR